MIMGHVATCIETNLHHSMGRLSLAPTHGQPTDIYWMTTTMEEWVWITTVSFGDVKITFFNECI